MIKIYKEIRDIVTVGASVTLLSTISWKNELHK